MLRKTVLSLKSPTGAFIAPLRCANANLFNKVQEKLAKNKKAPARHKAGESYLLTTKLYCGKCGALMFGESGVGHTGKMKNRKNYDAFNLSDTFTGCGLLISAGEHDQNDPPYQAAANNVNTS